MPFRAVQSVGCDRWRRAPKSRSTCTEVMTRKRINYQSQGAKRDHPKPNRVELNDGSNVSGDYLVIATGPTSPWTKSSAWSPARTRSMLPRRSRRAGTCGCSTGLRQKIRGRIVVGAVQGASCFGPAYEFAFILDAELRERKIRDKVPMTFVTSEPYIGHLGLDGVGDTKGLLEGQLREHHIKWITSAPRSPGRGRRDDGGRSWRRWRGAQDA